MGLVSAEATRRGIDNLTACVGEGGAPMAVVAGEGTDAVLIVEDERSAVEETLYLQSIPGMADAIGTHAYPTSDDINYALAGTGRAVCDGVPGPLSAGVCHICPKGSSHTFQTIGRSGVGV